MKDKDNQIHELKQELDQCKNLLKQRTEQANTNLKKMAKINMNMKTEIDTLKNHTHELQQQLDTSVRNSVKLADMDECYGALRKERQELINENDKLKREVNSFNSMVTINNSNNSNYTNCNNDDVNNTQSTLNLNYNNYNQNNHNNHNISNINNRSENRYKSPKVSTDSD